LTPKIVVVVLFSFFAVTVNVYDSLMAVDPTLLDVQRTLGCAGRLVHPGPCVLA